MRRLALLLLPALGLASVAAAQEAPALSIPLNAETLRGVPVTTGVFPADQLYKRDVRVQAYRLDDVLGRNVADLLGRGGLLAFADAEAGEARWAPVSYRDKPLNAEAVGNYLNWPGGAARKPVPWGVVTLELKPGN